MSTRVKQLEDDLLRTQAELGSLRNQLQPWESITPAQAIDDFRQINKKIKEVCRTISDSILEQKFADVPDSTTQDMADPARFARAIGGCDNAPSLLESPLGEGRPLEDVFEYGLRSIINQDLCAHIFHPFHPSLAGAQTRDVSKGLWLVYGQMRKQKSQLISGMWRANTFSTLDGEMRKDVDSFLSDFLGRLSTELKFLKGKGSKDDFVLSRDEYQQLGEIFRLAYSWNVKVKTGAVFTDFHPVGLKNDVFFDSPTMVPYDGLDMPKGSPRILCAVTLGLKSSEASKKGEDPSVVWQEKVQVLTREYFNDPEGEVVRVKAPAPTQEVVPVKVPPKEVVPTKVPAPKQEVVPVKAPPKGAVPAKVLVPKQEVVPVKAPPKGVAPVKVPALNEADKPGSGEGGMWRLWKWLKGTPGGPAEPDHATKGGRNRR